MLRKMLRFVLALVFGVLAVSANAPQAEAAAFAWCADFCESLSCFSQFDLEFADELCTAYCNNETAGVGACRAFDPTCPAYGEHNFICYTGIQ